MGGEADSWVEGHGPRTPLVDTEVALPALIRRQLGGHGYPVRANHSHELARFDQLTGYQLLCATELRTRGTRSEILGYTDVSRYAVLATVTAVDM